MVRLIPKDEKFFELFIEDGENLLAASRKLEEMVSVYDRLDERVSEIRALEHEGDEIDNELAARLERAFITPFDREDIHELVSRLDDVVDGIQEVAETFVIYDVSAPTDEARRLAGILLGQALQLVRGHREAGVDEGHRAPRAAIHTLENQADGMSRAADRRAVPGRDRGDRGHQVARRLHRAREHHRRRGGRGRDDRADRREERLSG